MTSKPLQDPRPGHSTRQAVRHGMTRNRQKMKKTLLLAILASCVVGCMRQRTPAAPVSVEEPALTAAVAPEAAGTVDSLHFECDCAEYTCYFAAGSLNRAALETVRRIVFDSPVCNVRLDTCTTHERAERLLARTRDSLVTLAWPDGAPWPEVRALFEAWAVRQLERDRIVYLAHSDPDYLLRCPETDSMLARCAAIIRSGDGYVGQVRSLWRESKYAIHGGSETEPTGADSLRHARRMLLQLLSNHINEKIHQRLGDNGTVDFCRNEKDFLRLFDSVRVESWEP